MDLYLSPLPSKPGAQLARPGGMREGDPGPVSPTTGKGPHTEAGDGLKNSLMH